LKADDSIILVHVYEKRGEVYVVDFPLASASYESENKDLLKFGNELLKKIQQILEGCGFKVQDCIVRDDDKEGIIKVANKEKVDVLLLGSRGLGPLKRAFLGSVSNYCVHHASCPVIVIKNDGKK